MTGVEAAPPRAAARTITASALGLVLASLAACLLLARTVVVASTTRSVPALALVYAAILGASILPRVPRGRRLASPWLVGAVGVVAIALAARLAGAPPPVPSAAFALGLNALAAVSEEALFRRLLYARVEALGAAAAIVLTATAFALIHVPLYGIAALPVDLGAGLLLSWQRWASGSWAAPAVTHLAANMLATLR